MTRTRLGIMVAAVLVAGTAGCGGDDEPDTSPDPSSPSSSAPTEPTTDSTSEPTEATPEPVEGERFELEGISFSLPEPYEGRQEGDVAVGARIGRDDPVASIEVLATPSVGEMTLDETRRIHLGSHFYDRAPRLLGPVMVDGVRMFHMAGRTSSTTWSEVFGSDETGYTIDLQLEFDIDVPETERQGVVDAVLGSIEVVG